MRACAGTCVETRRWRIHDRGATITVTLRPVTSSWNGPFQLFGIDPLRQYATPAPTTPPNSIGDHLLPGWLSILPIRGHASAKRLPSLIMAAFLLVASLVSPAASFAQTQTGVQTDPRLFPPTGYRIDRDSFWDYFSHRGGIGTFGYPASRDFQFEGCPSQFFQRVVLQQCGTQGVGTLNLLDEGLLPYTRMNGSTFPASDPFVLATTPKASAA